MESLTYLKNVKVSPKKLRMIRDNIYRLSPQKALDFLMYTPSKPAQVYYKAVHSAIHNAINTLKVQPDVLQFKLLTIEEGRKLKRFKAGSRGMAKPIERAYSHIKIILTERPQDAKVVGKVLPAEKKVEVVPVEAKKKESIAIKKTPKKAPKKVAAKKVTKSVTNTE